MRNWLDRPGYVALAAFAGGAIVALIVVLVVLFLRDGDDDEPDDVPPTATELATPGTPTVDPNVTPTVAATATPARASFATPEDALSNFVTNELNGTYIGPCPPEAPSGEQPPEGICSDELYRSAELATYNVGPYGSEALGEAVILPTENGQWTLSFFPFPPLDAQIQVGGTAMVFQAENCLNFRSAPNQTADVLSCQIDGTSATVIEGPTEVEGQTWWRLEGYGWAVQSFLAPVVQ